MIDLPRTAASRVKVTYDPEYLKRQSHEKDHKDCTLAREIMQSVAHVVAATASGMTPEQAIDALEKGSEKMWQWVQSD